MVSKTSSYWHFDYNRWQVTEDSTCLSLIVPAGDDYEDDDIDDDDDDDDKRSTSAYDLILYC